MKIDRTAMTQEQLAHAKAGCSVSEKSPDGL